MDANGIKYKIKTAPEEAIFIHLQACDADFFPRLTERVDIRAYSYKIFKRAATFEAWMGNRLVGLVAAYCTSSNSMFITDVSVLSEFMNFGVASTLLESCIQYAIEKKNSEVLLEVHRDNRRAIGLYRKFGFENSGENDSFVVMSIKLVK